ncbi:putative ribonuclease H-like domain-containing protein [Tanacetum coccineum]
MVACLEKSEGNTDFHEIVDFFTANSVHHALTQSTAHIDGKTVVILKSSVRSDLHFNDEDGITCLTNDAIFETSHCMGSVFTNMKRKGKDFSRRVTPLFASMLAPPVVEGEGSGQPSEPQPTPSTAQPRIEEQIPVTESSSPQNTQSPRKALQEDTQCPQTSMPILNIADESVFKGWDGKVLRATTTAASLDVAQASGNISKTQSTTMSNDPLSQEIGSGGNTPGSDEERIEQDDLTDFVPPTPHDSPLSGGHTPRSDDGRPNINELMAICTNLSNRVLALEQSKTAQDLVIRKLKKKGRKSDKTKPMFDDSDFAKIDVDNAMENVEVNTANIDVSAAGPSDVSTADPSTSTAEDIFKMRMLTIADNLWLLGAQRSKNTSVNIHDVEEDPRKLVAQGYTQEEGIDYDEVFASVVRIEAIRLFLAYASFKDFVMYQMDVKSAFLYGKIEEEVYVCQPLGFEDQDFPDRVYKVEKALYELHQAPRAWYETLSTYLLDNMFQRGEIDKTLFIRRNKGDILLVHVYVDGVIFGSTKKSLCTEFEKMMHKKFQMSSMGELAFFLGLQVKQKEDGIFISQDRYVTEILKKFGFSGVKTASTPMETHKPLLKDANGEDVDEHLYRFMIGSLMYLTSSRPDIMFATKIHIDNESTICIVKNPVFHSKTKHIRDSNEKKLIQMIKIHTDQNVADLITKAFDVSRFEYLIASITYYCWATAGSVNAVRLNLVLLVQVNVVEGHPTDPQHTSTTASPSQVEPITVPSSSQPKKTHRPRKAKRATEISQSSGPISLVVDKTVTKEREDRMERAATTASSLKAEQDRGNINRTQSMTTLNELSPQGTGSGSGPKFNTLRSGKDIMELKELMDLSTKLSDRVLDLETTKTAQAKEIASLKKRVKKPERKRKSKTSWMNLFKIDTSSRRSLGFDAYLDEVFKDVEGDAEQVISAATDEVSTGDSVNIVGTKVNTASALVTTASVSVSTAEPITTTSVNITTAKPTTPPTTTIVFEDEDLTISQTLVKMRSEKSKVRGAIMQEPSETATRPIVPPQQHDHKDKGKGKIVEQEKPLKKKDQIKFDEEIAQRLQAQMQAELEEEERLARKRKEDANIATWDNIQAMIDADYELAARLQAQEQEELTIEEKSRLFVELMDKRKKHFARLRAKEQRSREETLTKLKKEIKCYLSENMW